MGSVFAMSIKLMQPHTCQLTPADDLEDNGLLMKLSPLLVFLFQAGGKAVSGAP